MNKTPRSVTTRFVAFLLALGVGRALAANPAFPGAEGFGANATGGRGGTVYHVTNLNDSGTGSFRDAVSVAGRTVVFDVGGIITITSPVVVKSNVTIAGQTASGDGVTIYGDRISYSDANNTITRHIRYREGIGGDSGTDAVGAASGDTMMFDHVSASWGRDETFSLSGTPSNITLQDCIIGEGLLVHSAGSLMQTSGGVSIFRCLYIDNWMRNPKVKGVNDYQNNVVYNWGSGGGYIPAGDSAGLSYANLVNNYFIAGPNTGSEGPFKTGNANYSLYHSGNFQDLNVNGALDGAPVTDASFPTLTLVGTQFNYPAPATLLSAQQTYSYVLAHAGASLHRDHADTVMTGELASLGTTGAQIYSEADIGGVGTLTAGLALKDTDGDGIPDAWEEAMGTNPSVADNNGDRNGDGYTNLENYLNALAPAGVQAATIDGIVNDTGSSSSDGITADNTLVLRGTAAPGAIVTLARLDTGAIGTATANASGQWTFDYTGTPLADRYYAFVATVDLGGGKVSPPTRAFLVKIDTTAAATPLITNVVTTPTFSFSGTAEAGATVTVSRVGAGGVGTGVADGLGNWTAVYSGPALPAGTYSFTATATDLAGNTGATSAAYSVNTALAAPVFTTIVTDSGTAGDRITNDATLIFSGTSFAGAAVSISRDNLATPIGTVTANASGAWSFDYTGTTLTAGTHTFTATASNGTSSSPASAPFVFTIDTTRPVVSSIKRLNPATSATTASTLVFRVTFSEAVSGVDAGDFALTLSGVTGTIASCAPVSTSVYDVTVTSVAGDGTVRLDLKSSGTGISDVAANAINTGFTSGQVYTIRLPGSGVWNSDNSGETYGTAADWQGGIVASGVGTTADFSQQNLDGAFTVQLDAPRTLGRVVFGDLDFTAPALWTLGDNGAASNVLTLATSTGTPNLQVDGATSPSGDTVDVPAANAYPATLGVVLAGSSGFTKTGVGTLQIAKPATIAGPLTITKGIVQIGDGGSLAPSAVSIATSQQLRIAGGTFSTSGDVTWNSGTGTGIIVSAGTAAFKRILPSNARNSFVRVTGGVLTATEINFPRSGDSESQALGAGVLISGGDSTVGTIGLGTNNSWGAMTISGGRLTVTGALNVGFQATAGRGGDVVVSAGELDVTDATTGLILGRNPSTVGGTANANNVANFTITGGVSNITRLALGYDSSSSAGSATVSLTNGELNLGAAGLVKGGTSGMTTTVTLNSGTLGAAAAWSTSHPLVVTGTPANLALRAADRNGAAFNITLAGVLSGAGGFAKTGAGTLSLSATNTFAGDVAINAGTLAVNGSVSGTGAFAVNGGGTLAGTGTVNRSVALNAGGTLSPAGVAVGTVTATNLTWTGGGRLALDLGASGVSDVLALTGPLTKNATGSFELALNPTAGLTPGASYTVATFASTNFSAADFTVSGLPAGYAAAITLNSTNLRLTLVATPVITSPTTASGTYGQPFSYPIVATNSPASFGATGLPPGLVLNPATGLISGTPTAAGFYTVGLAASNLAGTGTSTLATTIAKALAVVAVGTPTSSTITRSYDGTAQNATVATTPAGLNATFTYNGSPTAPTLPGTYAVVATIDDPNYEGTASGTLVITITALVRHAPDLRGALDGSLQLLLPEPVALAGNTTVSGDLLVPGTPAVTLAGNALLADTKDAAGNADPADYTVSLAGNAVARYVVRRVDAIPMPPVNAPHTPAGTRDVVLHNNHANAGDFATIRNLTLDGDADAVTVPAGIYGDFTANGNGGFVLGVAGATTPAVYELQNLTLNGNATLALAGPVVLRLANDVTCNRTVGLATHPEWLTIELATASATLTGGATLHGSVLAPNGTIAIDGNSTLHGTVTADRLSIEGNSTLDDPTL